MIPVYTVRNASKNVVTDILTWEGVWWLLTFLHHCRSLLAWMNFFVKCPCTRCVLFHWEISQKSIATCIVYSMYLSQKHVILIVKKSWWARAQLSGKNLAASWPLSFQISVKSVRSELPVKKIWLHWQLQRLQHWALWAQSWCYHVAQKWCWCWSVIE